MKYYVIVDAGNAAFADGSGGITEIARVLRDVAAQVESGKLDVSARDMNGNKVAVGFPGDVAEERIADEIGE